MEPLGRIRWLDRFGVGDLGARHRWRLPPEAWVWCAWPGPERVARKQGAMKVESIGVLGAGLMGAGIAEVNSIQFKSRSI